jgi:hypothetical protein
VDYDRDRGLGGDETRFERDIAEMALAHKVIATSACRGAALSKAARPPEIKFGLLAGNHFQVHSSCL